MNRVALATAVCSKVNGRQRIDGDVFKYGIAASAVAENYEPYRVVAGSIVGMLRICKSTEIENS